ncbi:carboxypeptidase-like regulatory domain-containing protein [Hymenobacter sp. BRD128]|uniref:carboxypeptidase-like regulatory domain-containing protein n=1 Tax=Hymenobacter sp. BRD128 TaxID=2675878 RepID=UPI0015675B41|nr:carboxypeptidase-like regulatory domain-containing protein [Hymenobacter sp. BRD128]QKG57595.1 carboxypeptidase-like regulatory domain-containing protein [Hymenobacter sp. BRD128]
MLSLSKHLYRAVEGTNPIKVVEMLRQAQHDVLFFIVAGLLLLASPSLAQESPLLRGRVLDADTHQSIPNAQVGIGGNRLGTSTNAEGRFALRVPAAYRSSELEVALLGYRPYRHPLPPLPGPELLIELKISPASLSTVTVTASAEGIIREAVARIPLNFPVRPSQLTGFYRESDDEATRQRYDYLVEGLLRVYKPGYQYPHDQGQVQVLESRRGDLRPARPGAPLAPINWIAGAFVPHRFDFVHTRAEFIDAAHFKDYQYRLSPQTTFQGRAVYVVTFGPRPGADRANFAGEVYIDERSYAFLGARWHRTPAGIRRERMLVFEASERAYRADYQLYAGRYYLKSIWYNTLGKPLAGQVRHHLAEFVTTAIDTAQAPLPGYQARSQYTDVFLNNPAPYDSTFWQHYTTVLPPQALLDQTRQHQADTLLRRPAPTAAPTAPVAKKWNLLKHLRYSYTGGLLSVAVPTTEARVVLAPGGSVFRADGQASTTAQSLAAHYAFGAQLDLTPQLSAYATTRHLLGQLRGEGWEAGLGYARNLNPRGRPLRARAGLAYLRQSVGRELGTFANPDANLRLAGTPLAADQLTLSLQTITDAIQPRLGLGLELSHHWEAVADLGYLLPLRTRRQLLIEEKKGFFSFNEHAADLNLPATEASVFVANQPAAGGPWQLERLLLSVGVLYRLGQ